MTTVDAITASSDGTDSISSEVVLAVAQATGSDPTELDTLYNVVDPDALDQLFKPQQNGSKQPDGWVTFSINGCQVTVHANGDVVVTPPADQVTNGSD